jgi:chalcone isomerase-like protein
MITTRRLAALPAAALLAFALAPAAPAAELAGAKLPDTVDVGGKTLKLNGMGLRKKAIFKVYVGGLYLEAPSKDGVALAAADTPKAMRMQFLRSIDKAKLVEGFREGFASNSGALPVPKADMERFLGALPDVNDGDVITYQYEPGKGTAVSFQPKGGAAKELVSIPGKEFQNALFLVWVGPKPPTEDLKKGLLGS